MIFSKKVLTVALVVILVAVLIYFGFIRRGGDEAGSGGGDGSGPEKKVEAAPLPVKVADVRLGELVIKLKSPGEAVTGMQIDMKTEVSGPIKRIRVRESQHVNKGDVLLELDDRAYRLDLESSEAVRLQRLSELMLDRKYADSGDEETRPVDQKTRSARQEYDELSRLFQKGLISRAEYEERGQRLEMILIEAGDKKDEVMAAAKGLTQAEVNVKKARLDVEKCIVRAPFSGIITDIQVSPGEHLSAGADLFRLVNISRIQVHAKVLESEIGKMAVGREVDLRFSAFPRELLKGKVQAISPVINPEDKTCKVIIDVDNREEMIKPGMHAEVEIAAEIHRDRLLVPQDAVLTRDQRKLVFVVEDGLAKWRYMRVGLENDAYAEALPEEEGGESPVQPGMQVIVDGHFTIAHDARVRVVK